MTDIEKHVVCAIIESQKAIVRLWEALLAQDLSTVMDIDDDGDATAQTETCSHKTVCPVCGREFKPKSSRQRYCSHACYTKHQQATQQQRRDAEKAKKAAAEALTIEKLTEPLTEHRERISLAEANRIARENGVSYGEAVKQGLV